MYSEKCDKFYVGQTEDLGKRLMEHNTGKGGHFSNSCMPWELKYSEEFPSRDGSIKRE
jgi:putative endonuclease